MRVVKAMGCFALAALAAWGQNTPQTTPNQPAAPVPPPKTMETVIDVGKMVEQQEGKVVAVVDGEAITAKDITDFLRAMSPNVQANFKRNPEVFLKQYALLIHFDKLAQKTGMDKQYPYKQRLQMQRWTYLMNAQLEDFNNKVEVTDEERRAYFEQHKDNYRKGYFKVIYVPFSAAGAASGGNTEDAAKKKAEEVVTEARGGADFVELVKKYSEDAESKSKNGDFGPFTANDPSVPPSIRTAMFQLKPGEISEPLRHDNGYYVIRAEKFDQPEFDSVRSTLGEPIRRQKMDAWVRSQQNDTQIEIKDKSFFAPAAQPETK